MVKWKTLVTPLISPHEYFNKARSAGECHSDRHYQLQWYGAFPVSTLSNPVHINIHKLRKAAIELLYTIKMKSPIECSKGVISSIYSVMYFISYLQYLAILPLHMIHNWAGYLQVLHMWGKCVSLITRPRSIGARLSLKTWVRRHGDPRLMRWDTSTWKLVADNFSSVTQFLCCSSNCLSWENNSA